MSTQKPGDQSEQEIITERIQKGKEAPILKKYKKGKFLGKGGFAKCYEFQSLENGKIYAAKIINKSSLRQNRHRQKLLSEIKIHRSLQHENIVRFGHVFEDGKCVYILMELCTNQTLKELCKRRKRLTQFEARYYIFQLIHALKHLQKKRIIHRDLKLGNLFLSNGLQIKVGDFGLAAQLTSDSQKRRTVCGTPNYIAPEVLNNKMGHSYEVDVWSLGVIMYTLIVGKPPFETSQVKETYKLIRKCSYKFPESSRVTPDFKNLIKKIFQLDPSKRPSLDQIIEDPFINGGLDLPKQMHISTLTKEPSNELIQQMKPNQAKESDGEKDGEQEAGKAKYIYVKKWVDYSSKYGLGYLLSNDCSGVFFNDCTKIIYHPKEAFFQYIEKAENKKDFTRSYFIRSYPEKLHKKVTLLLHFQSYLENKKADQCSADKDAKEIPEERVRSFLKGSKSMIYLKKWMKTKHAKLLRLSNKIVQVAFNDKTEIILSSETKLVIFVNKKGERLEYAIGKALDSENTEMSRRLKYTKEILTHMLNSKPKN
jgi:polo-like kinase 1